jgi:hypothetical protein
VFDSSRISGTKALDFDHLLCFKRSFVSSESRWFVVLAAFKESSSVNSGRRKTSFSCLKVNSTIIEIQRFGEGTQIYC